MPFSCQIEGRIVHFCWSGVLHLAELQELGTEMPGLSTLVMQATGLPPQLLHNFDAVTDCDFPPVAVQAHSIRRQEMVIPWPVKSAVVASLGGGRSVARLFQALNRSNNLRLELFDSEAAAREWLDRE